MNGIYIQLNTEDNVVVALKDLPRGTELDFNGRRIRLTDDIPRGHKIAVRAVGTGDRIVKYGAAVGRATGDIRPGSLVHTHNMETLLMSVEEYEYSAASGQQAQKPAAAGLKETFMGYKREDGRIGIRNEIWIINTVGCVNRTAEILAARADNSVRERCDGIFSFSHPCGCSQLGGDLENTQKVLAGLVRHPNAGGVLVLGLGCENNNIKEFKKVLGIWNPERVRFLEVQDVRDEIEAGLEIIEELSFLLENDERKECPVSELVVGLKCGGSDGLSGVTANPLIGKNADMLAASGATLLLTEVPEMFGAEHFLMGRALNENVFNKIVGLINNFKLYFKRYGCEIYENPSPGNREGGITTLEDKSCGCIQKGGTSTVTDVLSYAESPVSGGLNLLDGPGNDGVSVTNMTASGAQLILFSTGRGTPLGGPVPTVKISTNTELAEKKPRWIDFDAGRLLAGEPADDLSRELYDLILKTASGEKTGNELGGYREISIFRDGVTL